MSGAHFDNYKALTSLETARKLTTYFQAIGNADANGYQDYCYKKGTVDEFVIRLDKKPSTGDSFYSLAVDQGKLAQTGDKKRQTFILNLCKDAATTNYRPAVQYLKTLEPTSAASSALPRAKSLVERGSDVSPRIALPRARSVVTRGDDLFESEPLNPRLFAAQKSHGIVTRMSKEEEAAAEQLDLPRQAVL